VTDLRSIHVPRPGLADADTSWAGAVSSGPLDWSWYYPLKDNCGHTETWLDADNDNSGQDAIGPFATDITAPGPGSCS
jgi:hypothetical protein